MISTPVGLRPFMANVVKDLENIMQKMIVGSNQNIGPTTAENEPSETKSETKQERTISETKQERTISGTKQERTISESIKTRSPNPENKERINRKMRDIREKSSKLCF